jgi:uncharacterized protein (TIGR02231 family)
LAAGSHEVVVDNLPLTLMPESVRVAAKANVGARLLATDVRRTFHREPKDERVAELTKEIENLEERDHALKKREDALETRRNFLNTLASAAGQELARGIAFGRTQVEIGGQVGEFLTAQFGVMDETAATIARERRELEKELSALRRRLQQLQQQPPTERQQIVVLVELKAEGKLSLELRYQVNHANWQPLYDVRLTENDKADLTVTYQAQVTQRSGENWENVELSLSTAKPAVSAIAPELKPWFLEAYQPVPVVGAPMVGERMLRAQIAVVAAAPEEKGKLEVALDADVATAEVEESGAAVTFRIGGRSGVPSDGSPHKVTIGHFGLPCRLDYVTAPKLAQQAYRRATVTNDSEAIFLPGAAQIFVGDEFIGSTALKTVAPRQEFEVYLGVDDRIKVERELVTGSVDKKFLQDKAILTYAYTIKVSNLKSSREPVTVCDQIPISRHELVRVRRQDVTPKPNEETDMGELKWTLTLAPNETREIRFEFTIERPRDLQLVGLPPLRE